MIAPKMQKTSTGWDVVFEDGKIPTVTDGEQAAQHFGQRYQTNKGEYGLDGQISNKENVGTRIYDVLFNHQKSRAEKDLEIKRILLGTPDVKRILTPFAWTIVGQRATVTGDVLTEWGVVHINQTLEMLE